MAQAAIPEAEMPAVDKLRGTSTKSSIRRIREIIYCGAKCTLCGGVSMVTCQEIPKFLFTVVISES